MQKITPLLILSAAFYVSFAAASDAKKEQKTQSGEVIFQEHCSKCHIGGGNRVSPGHDVAGSKQLVSLISFKAYLSKPPGHMPYYQDIIGSPKSLKALYDYCKTLKKQPMNQASIECLN